MIRYGLQWQALQDYLAIEETSNSSSWGKGGTGTPPANLIFLYAKDKSNTSALYFKNDAGVESEIPAGTIVTGTGTSGRLAFWSGTSTLSSDADLTFSTDTLTATKIIAPTSITISTLTPGSIVFAGAAGLLSQDNANLFWDDTNNRLGIGTAVPGFQIHAIAPDASSFNCTIEAYGTGVSANYRGRVARGTLASPSQLLTDDNCTLMSALPYNSSPGFAGGARAQIQMNAAESQTSTNQGMYITFKTTPTGSTTIAERFRIGPVGQWGIGGATFGTAGQYFRSGGASAAPTWATISDADLGSIFFLLAGRSGGQTAIGGTAAADSLNLVATAGVGAGSEQINFKVGSNGAKTLGTFQIVSSTPTFTLNTAAASTQFNLCFADNGTNKWILYKTAAHVFNIYDAVANDDVLTFTPLGSIAAAAAAVTFDPTISNGNATEIGFFIKPNFTGAGPGPWGASISASFAPSASIGACYNSLNQGTFNPATSITITGAYSAYYACVYGNTAGAVTSGYTLWLNAPTIVGSLKPTNQYGLYIQNQGAAGMTNAYGVHIDAMSGGTNSFDMSFGRVDTTAAGAYYGRIPVLYNGLLKYIHVFSA